MPSPYPNWKILVRDGRLIERTPAKLFDVPKLKLKNQYVKPDDYVRETLTESTLLRYPDGKLMALFLKGVIPPPIQSSALAACSLMEFKDPTRPETRGAIDFNGTAAPVRAGELTFGFMDRGSVTRTDPTKYQWDKFAALAPLLKTMNDIYARTVPQQFGDQNKPYAENLTKTGGIHAAFRNFTTAFSTISVLRSCPAAVHVDNGNGQGYSVLTGVRGEDFQGGGEFALIEYGLKIPVTPGDLLIGATMREWHLNLTPVRGTKYSVICYYRRGLGSLKRREGYAARQAKKS